MLLRLLGLLIALLDGAGSASLETLTPAHVGMILAPGMPACGEQADTGECARYDGSMVQLLANAEVECTFRSGPAGRFGGAAAR